MIGCVSSRGPAHEMVNPLEALLAPPAWPASATDDAPTLDTEMLARAIHTRVNEVRVTHGLAPLAWADRLAEVALAHSRDMAGHPFFGHTNPRGQEPGDRARKAGLAGQVQVGPYVIEGIGENLFLTHHYAAYHIFEQADGPRTFVFDWKTPDEIAQEAVMLWMQSPTHRANLLSSFYQAAAVGVVHSANETLFITQNFTCQAAGSLASSLQ